MSIGLRNWNLVLADLFHHETHFLHIGVNKGEIINKIDSVLLDHPNSTYTGIDEWPDADIEKIAIQNATKTGFLEKINFMKMSSFDGLSSLIQKKAVFDVIFIDPSYDVKDVMSDALLAWRLLKIDGILIFDDYIWKSDVLEYKTPKFTIDTFVFLFKNEVNVLTTERQIFLQKISPSRNITTIMINNNITQHVDDFWNKYAEPNEIPLPITKFSKLNFELVPLSTLKPQLIKYFEYCLKLVIQEKPLTFLRFAYSRLNLNFEGLDDLPLIKKIKEFELFDNSHITHYHFLTNLVSFFSQSKDVVDILYFRTNTVEKPEEHFEVRDNLNMNLSGRKIKTRILNTLKLHEKTAIDIYTDITLRDIEIDLEAVKSDMTDVLFGTNGWHKWILFTDIDSALKLVYYQQKFLIYSLIICLKVLRNGGVYSIGCNDLKLPFLGDYILILRKIFKRVEVNTNYNNIYFPLIEITAYGFVKKGLERLTKILKHILKNYSGNMGGSILERFLTNEHNIHEIISENNEMFLNDSVVLVQKIINKYSDEIMNLDGGKITNDLQHLKYKRTIEAIEKLFKIKRKSVIRTKI